MHIMNTVLLLEQALRAYPEPRRLSLDVDESGAVELHLTVTGNQPVVVPGFEDKVISRGETVVPIEAVGVPDRLVAVSTYASIRLD